MAIFLTWFLFIADISQMDHDQWKQAQCLGESVSGQYINYADGFSLAIPNGYKGRKGQAAGA